jgi:NAD(P)H-hydrate epimerase
MVQPLAQDGDFTRLLSDPRYTACLIGPGAGVNDRTRRTALEMLATARPVLLDADAISVFASRVDELAQAIQGPCVMTPHDGEFARLSSPPQTSWPCSRRGAPQRRGHGIERSRYGDCGPDGRAIINTNAPPGLATAGSGDVLGGLILGLLAQGMNAFLAAAAGGG